MALFAIANSPYRPGQVRFTKTATSIVAVLGSFTISLSRDIKTTRVRNFSVVTGFSDFNELNVKYNGESVSLAELKETTGYNLAVEELKKRVTF